MHCRSFFMVLLQEVSKHCLLNIYSKQAAFRIRVTIILNWCGTRGAKFTTGTRSTYHKSPQSVPLRPNPLISEPIRPLVKHQEWGLEPWWHNSQLTPVSLHMYCRPIRDQHVYRIDPSFNTTTYILLSPDCFAFSFQAAKLQLIQNYVTKAEIYVHGTHKQKLSNVHFVNTSWQAVRHPITNSMSSSAFFSRVSCNKHIVEKTCLFVLEYRI